VRPPLVEHFQIVFCAALIRGRDPAIGPLGKPLGLDVDGFFLGLCLRHEDDEEGLSILRIGSNIGAHRRQQGISALRGQIGLEFVRVGDTDESVFLQAREEGRSLGFGAEDQVPAPKAGFVGKSHDGRQNAPVYLGTALGLDLKAFVLVLEAGKEVIQGQNAHASPPPSPRSRQAASAAFNSSRMAAAWERACS
jgi:hypothetical protein